jgi:hypothetical protein
MFMTSNEPADQKKFDLNRVLRILAQILITIAIFAALLWYVGLGSLYNALFHLNLGCLALSFLAYFD